ncbi:MAG: helix-turn-helix transcriptional regulator [Deltaproteobacteria bacterium]|nr:helix-turn-helix transcriptional regulator [Deltaproteobacteria bacterium]
MLLVGKIWKEKKHYLIEIEELDLLTQGRTKKEAYEMIKDAVESLVNKKDFSVELYRDKKDVFYIEANNPGLLMALILKRQREKYCLSIRDLQKRLKFKSPNAYAQYESGKHLPTLGKFQQFLEAMDPNLIPVISLKHTEISASNIR